MGIARFLGDFRDYIPENPQILGQGWGQYYWGTPENPRNADASKEIMKKTAFTLAERQNFES